MPYSIFIPKITHIAHFIQEIVGLRTYAIFKTEIGCEKYLNEITNITDRQSLAKFRLSNNTLNIEKGRHTTPKTPKELRFCPFCPNRVEDEVHFLLECLTYQFPRSQILQNIANDTQTFLHKTSNEQLLALMTHEDAQFVAKTINTLFEIRNFLINKPKMLT